MPEQWCTLPFFYVSILSHYLFSLYSLFLFAIRLPLSLRFALSLVSLALCIQTSRVDTGSFTFTFKVQPNDKSYIFIILVTVLGCYVDYLTKLYQFRSLATSCKNKHTKFTYVKKKGDYWRVHNVNSCNSLKKLGGTTDGSLWLHQGSESVISRY